MIYPIEVNGQVHKIEADSPEEAISIAEFMRNSEPAPAAPSAPAPVAPPGDGGTLGDILTGAMMGGSLGFLEDIGSLAASYLTTEAERAAAGIGSREEAGDIVSQAILDRFNLAKERSPVVSTIGEFAGGMLGPGGLLFKGAKMIPGMTTLGALTGAGAVEGGLAGAGYSTGQTPAEIAADAAMGGATGAVVAPVAGYAASALGQVGQALLRKIRSSPKADARKLVLEAMRADQISPAEANAIMGEIGPEAVLADVSPNLQGLAGTAYRIPGPGKALARETLEARRAGQGERIGDISAETLGPQWRDYNEMADVLMAERSARAKPLYDDAYSRAVAPTERMEKALKTPAGQDAMRRATTNMANKLDLQWSAGDAMTADGRISVRYLDQVKVELDDMIGAAKLAEEKGRARDLIGIKRALTQDMDQQVPTYAQARNIFAGATRLKEAAERGRELLRERKTFAGDLRGEIRDYSEGEMEALRVGFFRGILDQVETTIGAGDAARRALRDQRTKDIAELVFPNEAAFAQFVRRMVGEQQMGQTAYRVLEGPLTAERLAMDAGTAEGLSTAADLASAAATGSVYPLVGGMANALRKTRHVTPEIADEMSRILFGHGIDPKLLRSSLPFSERMSVGPALGMGSVVPSVEMMLAP